MSIYVLHTTLNGERAKYSSFQTAFKAFKDATRNVHSDAALWYGSDLAQWTRVYCTEHYPTGLSRPWDKPRPHSFFQKEGDNGEN
jgi:hypothetical protein